MSKIRFIDVIRVLGLISVLSYHLFQDVLPGGFLGVDIFFTFSGYLITSLIIATFTKENDFDFVSYLKRRFSRIFPTLFFSLIFTLPFVRLLPNDFTVNIDKQITAALGFVTNYFEISSGGTYEAKLIPHLYVHTWSLAIEFHYYIIWGSLAALFSFIFSKCKNKNKLFKLSLLFSSVVLGVLSYFNMQSLFLSNKNSSVAYFATTSHIYSFFIGSILGVLFGLKLSDKLKEKLKDLSIVFKVLNIILLPVIFVIIFILCRKTNFESNFTYKYGFLIISTLTFLLIFLTRALHEIISEKFKESFLINHIATISYAMYLFHWPFYIIFSNIIASNLVSALCTIACSYIFSVFTVYNIEPFFYKSRYQEKTQFFKKNIIITCVLSTICIYFSYSTITNRQIISALQEEQMIGNIIQNIDKIEYLEQSLKNINDDPLLQNDLNNKEQPKESSTNSDVLQPTDSSAINDKTSTESTSDTNNLTPTESTSDTNNLTPTESTSDTDNLTPTESTSDTDKNNNVHPTVTIIGDSVTLGARKKLLETIPNSYVDAKGSRNLKAGYEIFKEFQKTDNLGECVVIALGTNGIPAFATYIQKFIDELPSGHRLIFVTPYDGRWTDTWNSYKTTQHLRSIKDKYDFVTIADWAELVSHDPASIVGSDKIHIGGNKKGIQVFVDNIQSSIDTAITKRAK